MRAEMVAENIILSKGSFKIAILSSSLYCGRVDDGHYQMKTSRLGKNNN